MIFIAPLLALIAPIFLAGEDLLIKEIEVTASLLGSESIQENVIEAALAEQGIDPKSIRAKIARRYLAHFLNVFSAYPVYQDGAPRCHAIIERLCKKMGIKKPVVAISPLLNNAAARSFSGMPPIIIIGAPFIGKLTDAECEALIAHELSHIAQCHFEKSIAIAFMLTAGITIPVKIYCHLWMHAKYSNGFAGKTKLALAREVIKDAVIIGVTTTLIDRLALLSLMKVSRTYEYSADKQAAETLGSPDSSLAWLERNASSEVAREIANWQAESTNPENPWYTRLRYTTMIWFLSHPTDEARIAELKAQWAVA